MHPFFLVIVLSIHVGYSITSSDSQKHGSHKLLNLERSNNSAQRAVRCTPCEKDSRPISNHLDPEYRGNGADNLGYDWSSMAWGGPAFPRRSMGHMGGMRGRDGRMMLGDGGRNQGNLQVVCDTCRSYWDGDRGGDNRGRHFVMPQGQNFYGGQPGYWQGDRMGSRQDYETRVMSPTVGVLVKPGSRIAYIPSRSGEMFWDGVSGGGTRWDGFSNGISWIGNAPGVPGMPESDWDRSDPEPRDGPPSMRPGSHYPRGPNSFGPWDGQKRPVWGDTPGRGYYFTNGVPNVIDPQWRDRGYASNWHYGSTDQNGWNGNNMKWNYGGKQWLDNDRAANRFYFNTPQDRTYGPNDAQHNQYGNQYPNYQPAGGNPASFRPQPSWPTGGGYRPNDRFPSNFQSGNYGGDKDRPWDYTSRDPFGYRGPGPRPEWARPGPSYPPQGSYVTNQGKVNYGGYDKYSPSDKTDFERPWPSGYGPSKPGSAGGFPYGGTRYPEEGSGGGGRPTYPAGGGHLFFPNDNNRQPNYPNTGSIDSRPGYPTDSRKPGEYPSSGNQVGSFSGDGSRPSAEYPGDKRPSVTYTGGRPAGGGGGGSPGGYPAGGSSTGGYPSDGSSSGGYPNGGTSGGYPSGGSSSGGHPSGGTSSGGYPSGGSSSGGYPSGGSSSGGYPSGGSTSGGYPSGGSSSGGYPSGGSSSGGYPGGGSTSSGYPTESSLGGYQNGGNYPGGSRPSGYPGPSNGYPSGGSSYPSGSSRPGGYPAGGIRPGSRPDNYYGGGDSPEGYPSGGGSYPRPSVYPGGGSSYPGGNTPGFYPDEGFPTSGYYGGGAPTGYPTAGRPGGYPGNGYPSGGRPGYPTRGPSYPGAGSGGIYQQGSKNPPKGYYTGFITELNANGQPQYGGNYPNYFGSSYPRDKNFYPGSNRNKYFNGGSYSNERPPGDKNRYPPFIEDRYSGAGGGGGGYPAGDSNGGGNKYYYGQSDGKGKYPMGYPSNHRFPNGGGDDYDRNQSFNNDKNSWNYGQNERKDGIYRRSGGSYPPYRGGQYYTSSYLASMSTTAGSTEAGGDPKTQEETKTDEVTQPTSESS